jgi:hypothetical protein
MTVLRSYFRTIIVTLSLMGSTLAVSARSSACAIGHVSSASTIQQPSSAKSAKSAETTVSQTGSSTNTQGETQTSNSVTPPALSTTQQTQSPTPQGKESKSSAEGSTSLSTESTVNQKSSAPQTSAATATTPKDSTQNAAPTQSATTEGQSVTDVNKPTSKNLKDISSSKASAQMNIVPVDSTLIKKGKHAKVKSPKKKAKSNVADSTKRLSSNTAPKQFQVEGGVLKMVTPTTAEQILSKDTEIDTLTQPSLKPLKEEVALTDKQADSSKVKKRKEEDTSSVRYSSIFRDTIPLSRMTALSLVAPGFSQLYNKQAWKIPILYGVTGGLAVLGFNQSNKYKAAKNEYNTLVNQQATQEELDPAQCKMIRYNTTRTVFFVGAIASYLYFLGDGVLNYNGPENSVKKATTLAMICPGAGQLYNKSYWKVPIVVGAFATMGYVIDWNARGYKRYRTAYNQVVNGQPDEFEGRYSADYLKNMKDNFRRNRDLCIILTGALYLLNVVDAHVDAHLKDYDISDDLSVRLEPTVFQNYASRNGYYGVGMSLKVTF